MPSALLARIAVVASVLAVGAASTRADTLAPPGMVAPSPPVRHKLLPSWLEADVRTGIGYMDYFSTTLGGAEPSGAAWFVDAELGWRHGRWAVSGFSSFLYSPDQGGDDDENVWNVRFHIVEVGVRGTWHLGTFSVGIGYIPLVLGRGYGGNTLYGQAPCPSAPDGQVGTVINSRYTSWDVLAGAELHAAHDVTTVADVTLEVFGLVEFAQSYGQDATFMFTARLGVGVRF
jgi:hypothetical protein